jgi:hypothetical protein
MLEYSHVEGLRLRSEGANRDIVLENLVLFVRQGLELKAFYKSVRAGDVGIMEFIMELWGPQFVGGKLNNYGDALMDIRVGMEAEWAPELKTIIRQNWVINPWGKSGKFLGLDEFMEGLVRNLKELYNPGGSDVLERYMREVTARCVGYFMRIKEGLRVAMGQRKRSGNHVKRDRGGDVHALRDYILREGLVDIVLGRSEVEVVDNMAAGLERLVDGVWWQEFLLRSPGCARVMNRETLGRRGNVDVDEEMGEVAEEATDLLD